MSEKVLRSDDDINKLSESFHNWTEQTHQNAIPKETEKLAADGVAKYNERWIKNLTEIAPGIFVTRNVIQNLKNAINKLEQSGRI